MGMKYKEKKEIEMNTYEIYGFSNYYATDRGEIISKRCNLPRLLKTRIHKGYLHVFIRSGKGRATIKKEPVHKLVLLAFYGPKLGIEYQCRHLNGNPLDNRPENLRWGTALENHKDSIKHKTAICLRFGERHPCAKLKDEEVKEIRNKLTQGIKQIELAKQYGVSQKHISDIKLCRTRIGGGDQSLQIEKG